MVNKLLWMVSRTDEFFEAAREEGYRAPFVFLVQVSGIIAFFVGATLLEFATKGTMGGL